jgi:hypothetical protein
METISNSSCFGGNSARTRNVSHLWRGSTILVLALQLNGCGLWVHTLNGNAQRLVSADPLTVTDPNSDDGKKLLTIDTDTKDDTPKLAFLGRVVLDSETKCQRFLNGLVIAENTVNTTGDITSVVLTGLASVFTPLTTVHALTAGSTVVTGSKASINANIYAKMSIVNFQTALTQSYAQAIKDYTDALPHMKDVIVTNEVVKIQAVHDTCTLASSEAVIQTKLGSQGQAPAKPTGLKAEPLNGGVKLSWTLVPGATSYSILQGPKPGAESDTPVKTGITGTDFTVAPLANDTLFYFQITAQNKGGSSPKSDEVSATPSSSVVGGAAVGTPEQPTETHAPVPGQSKQ